jgi:hypothetical protein
MPTKQAQDQASSWARQGNCIHHVKENIMKRTIATLSLALVFAIGAFGQTSQLQQKLSCCGSCCPDGCGQTCCQDGCAKCCNGK